MLRIILKSGEVIEEEELTFKDIMVSDEVYTTKELLIPKDSVDYMQIINEEI